MVFVAMDKVRPMECTTLHSAHVVAIDTLYIYVLCKSLKRQSVGGSFNDYTSCRTCFFMYHG